VNIQQTQPIAGVTVAMTSSQHTYEVRPRKDHRGVDLISDALPQSFAADHNEPSFAFMMMRAK